MTSKTFALLALTAALAASGSAFAQTVINHSKALAGNVTPGDAAGYPITISTPGHYVLKSNLTVPNGVSGVVIQTEGVTLDLNGYTIGGGRTCSQDYVTQITTCSASGGFRGIEAGGSLYTVRNGTVRGFDIGLWTDGGLVENVVASHNVVGIFIGNNRPTRLTGVLVEESSQAGINADSGALIDNAVVARNTIGIDGQGSSWTIVRDSAIYSNNVGMKDGVIRSTRVAGNNTNLIGTGSY